MGTDSSLTGNVTAITSTFLAIRAEVMGFVTRPETTRALHAFQ